ncbi:NADH-quinone oxidoreductase subunit J [Aquihabitans sp. G128]|uniref:NADH-quinone oxidoreductase subunit J family protein n=1 Tax=Aquihabitans sp. G128 TaxID=2849779 RepID=UPI001C245B47|nr:NADH-quinone oxidoreductase subunit J [Aquihabitans sp. G128]QXC60189.1 NADH-quinone oxidoreductase subunit J [Aquihabitans sp. G128]
MGGLLLAAAANADAGVYVAQNVAFGIIAALMVFSAFRVVTTDNVVHAAFYLVMVLAGAAAQFILLGAEFIAITQVLVYIGAIVVLFLFGIMLTKAPMSGEEKLSRDNWALGALTSVVLLALLGYVLVDGFGKDKLPADLLPTPTAAISDAIFGGYLIPFEVISLLLLAALIGAIVIARRD